MIISQKPWHILINGKITQIQDASGKTIGLFYEYNDAEFVIDSIFKNEIRYNNLVSKIEELADMIDN